jgi:hypothetical protein
MSPKLCAFFMSAAFLLIGTVALAQTDQGKAEGKVTFKPTTQVIRVVAPNGGELIRLGSSMDVQWELLTKDTIDSIQIRLIGVKEAMDSSPPHVLTSLVKPLSSSWKWENAGPAAKELRIEIEAYSSKRSGIVDASDKPFSIVESKITVLSPNGGEVFGETTTAVIEWSNPFLDGTPVPEGNFRILISRDGGRNYSALIADRIAVTESTFNWIVEAPPSIEARIKVLFAPASPSTNIIEDNSDGDFRIVAGIRKAPTEVHD